MLRLASRSEPEVLLTLTSGAVTATSSDRPLGVEADWIDVDLGWVDWEKVVAIVWREYTP